MSDNIELDANNSKTSQPDSIQASREMSDKEELMLTTRELEQPVSLQASREMSDKEELMLTTRELASLPTRIKRNIGQRRTLCQQLGH